MEALQTTPAAFRTLLIPIAAHVPSGNSSQSVWLDHLANINQQRALLNLLNGFGPQGCQDPHDLPHGDKRKRVLMACGVLQEEPHPKGGCSSCVCRTCVRSELHQAIPVLQCAAARPSLSSSSASMSQHAGKGSCMPPPPCCAHALQRPVRLGRLACTHCLALLGACRYAAVLSSLLHATHISPHPCAGGAGRQLR
jgi:hypothetical protein